MRVIGLVLLLLLLGCDDKSYRVDNSNYLMENKNKNLGSTTSGNLVTTAIKEVHGLDIVFYPSDFLDANGIGLLKRNLPVNSILDMYPPEGSHDQFAIGTMKGSAIKDFIRSRVMISYSADLQVAGIEYFASFTGGIGDVSFRRKYEAPLVDDHYYKVAISNFYYFSGTTFPSYQYGNNLDYDFKFAVTPMISARQAVAQFVENHPEGFPELSEIRAKVINNTVGDAGSVAIYDIQGDSHRSPYLGKTVTTTGIVTAIGSRAWYPGGIDLYIQDARGDGNSKTSDGIHIYLNQDDTTLKLQDMIEVSGVVYEQMTGTGLGRTSLREISQIRLLSENNELPAPITLGINGRRIPDRIVSTYNGDLNFKKGLTLTDGIDFFESIEGMRVRLENPRLAGFRGGKEDYTDHGKAKGYLTLYVRPDGTELHPNATDKGGLMSLPEIEDYNPELIMVTTNHLTKGINTKTIFNVGNLIQGELVGVMSYEKNIFGDGEYTMVLPEDQNISTKLISEKEDEKANYMVPFDKRPITRLVANDSQLTVATYNVENLAGNQWERLENIGTSIAVNLGCPDIVNLVEIQDLNGAVFTGSSSADETLRRLISFIKCGKDIVYKAVNINPVDHAEGGEPGGNIRVAHIYNSSKITFTARGSDDPLAKALVLDDGSLNNNPGRIFPMSAAFQNTRKSLVVEYKFKGEKIFVIGNHFKSKLGDSAHWGSVHPIIYASDAKRVQMAARVKEFVDMAYYRNPRAHVIVLGDFNAYPNEYSMKVLEAAKLYNMVGLLPPNDRYTHNYNGSSNALDHIFAGPNLMSKDAEAEIIHINTDYMGRLSDHDPVLARFQF